MIEYRDVRTRYFSEVDEFMQFLKNGYSKRIDYSNIRFDHTPERIVLIEADGEPKDIISYYRTKHGKGSSIGKEIIDLRKKK